MNPQAVTVGARVGHQLNNVLAAASAKSPDPCAWYGGMIAAVIGGIGSQIGRHATIALVRICLTRLEQGAGIQPLELPPGVREQIDAAAFSTAESVVAGAVDASEVSDVLVKGMRDQVEAMRRVLAVVSAKAGIEAEQLLELLNESHSAVQAERQGTAATPATSTSTEGNTQ